MLQVKFRNMFLLSSQRPPAASHFACAPLQIMLGRGVTCFVPRYEETGTMNMLRVHTMDDVFSLPTTRWGIRQPAGFYGLHHWGILEHH